VAVYNFTKDNHDNPNDLFMYPHTPGPKYGSTS